MPGKIPATVVTGFLGSGKTTMIRHLLNEAQGLRIALIVNEFGDLGVDGDILKGCGDAACSDEDIVELSNGCICCTVADDFVPTLERLVARDPAPDHIVIETSGLALPQPLVRAFNWPELATKVTVDSVITVVDGPAVRDGRFAHSVAAVDAQRQSDSSLDHETPLSALFEDQVACADMIVVNKTDLMEPRDVERLDTDLHQGARAGVQIVHTSHGALSPAVLLGQGAAAENDLSARHEKHHDHDHHHDSNVGHDHDHHHDHDHDHHHDHDHDAFESFVVTRGEVTDPEAFSAQVSHVIRDHNILRLKGFVAVQAKPMRLSLQAVGPRVDTYFDRPFDAMTPRETRLVVIGETGMDRAAITNALQ